MKSAIFLLSTITLLLAMNTTSCAQNKITEWPPEFTEQWPAIEEYVEAAGVFTPPPSDAIVLFDGTNLDAWQQAPGYFPHMEGVPGYLNELRAADGDAPWRVENGVMTVVPGSGNIMTRQHFGSVHLHLEWRTPEEISGEGQGRGNSGVFLMGLYEIQVLDSWQNPTYGNGQAGAIYKQKPPRVNASRPPGEWQSYDIFFEAPYFDEEGQMIRPATITVLHNGILLHHRQELQGPTTFIGPSFYHPHPDRLPLGLQDHGDLVSFRNIWVREL
ncbi:MAG: DUF1080 domain-containing protein [Balneolaceae bacterium]